MVDIIPTAHQLYVEYYELCFIWQMFDRKHEFVHGTKEQMIPDSQVHGANTGPTLVLSPPDGPRVGPMTRAITCPGMVTDRVMIACYCI